MAEPAKNCVSSQGGHFDSPLMKLVNAASILQNQAAKNLNQDDPPVESIEIENLSYSSQSVGDLSDDSDFSDGKVAIGTREDLYQRNRKVSFAEQLMAILDDDVNSEVLTWVPDGQGFTIIDHQLFVREKMQKLFKIQNMSSFVRKLNRWGFKRLHEKGSCNCDTFRHALFRRGRKDLVKKIGCVKRPLKQESHRPVSETECSYPVQFHRKPRRTTTFNICRSTVTPPIAHKVSALKGNRSLIATPLLMTEPPRFTSSSGLFGLSSQTSELKHNVIHDMTDRVVYAALETLRRDESQSLRPEVVSRHLWQQRSAPMEMYVSRTSLDQRYEYQILGKLHATSPPATGSFLRAHFR